MSKRRNRFRGQGLVEFALVGPIFFLMLLGTIEMGRLMWVSHELSSGTSEGARWASVHGQRWEESSSDTIVWADVEEVILDHTTALGSSLNGQLTYSSSDREPGSTVIVSTTYQYQPMVGTFLGIGPINLSRQSELTIQY